MLDEKKEYWEYCHLIQSGRLNKDNLKNGRSGLRRAMIILARHFLFQDNSQQSLEERIVLAINALRVWRGYMDSTEPEFEELLAGENLRQYLCDSADKELNVMWSEKFEERLCKDNYADDLDSTITYSSKNTENRMTYQEILAHACNDGPLKTRYLVLDGNPPENKKPIELDETLKFFAALLMSRDTYYASQRFIPVTKTDVANWAGKKTDKLKADKTIFDSSGWKRTAEKHENASKVRIRDAWVTRVHLCSSEEIRQKISALPAKPEHMQILCYGQKLYYGNLSDENAIGLIELAVSQSSKPKLEQSRPDSGRLCGELQELLGRKVSVKKTGSGIAMCGNPLCRFYMDNGSGRSLIEICLYGEQTLSKQDGLPAMLQIRRKSDYTDYIVLRNPDSGKWEYLLCGKRSNEEERTLILDSLVEDGADLQSIRQYHPDKPLENIFASVRNKFDKKMKQEKSKLKPVLDYGFKISYVMDTAGNGVNELLKKVAEN